MKTDQNNIIKELREKIVTLELELNEANKQRDKIKKQFDELKVILRET